MGAERSRNQKKKKQKELLNNHDGLSEICHIMVNIEVRLKVSEDMKSIRFPLLFLYFTSRVSPDSIMRLQSYCVSEVEKNVAIEGVKEIEKKVVKEGVMMIEIGLQMSELGGGRIF